MATLVTFFASRARQAAARLALAAIIVAASAEAHAFLARATPAVGSTVETPPTAIDLEFTEEIEPAFSTVAVVHADGGAPVKVGAAEHPTPQALHVALPTLEAGTYEVRWSALSIDTHKTEGRFKFHVAPR